MTHRLATVEYDVRRPLTPTGTNLLGLVKHVAGVELDYLGTCVGRPSPVPLPWVEDGSIWEGADLWATAEPSRREIVDLYHAAWQHSDESIAELDLATPAHVSWWRPERRGTTFGELLVRVVAETAQRAGHADIVRELIDGRAGADHDELGDADWWAAYVQRVQDAAERHRTTGSADTGVPLPRRPDGQWAVTPVAMAQPMAALRSDRIRDSSRETCIWVTPMSRAICSWVQP